MMFSRIVRCGSGPDKITVTLKSFSRLRFEASKRDSGPINLYVLASLLPYLFNRPVKLFPPGKSGIQHSEKLDINFLFKIRTIGAIHPNRFGMRTLLWCVINIDGTFLDQHP